MAKKNFIGKKPEIQIQAEAVEAFLDNSPLGNEPLAPEAFASDPAEKEESLVIASSSVDPKEANKNSPSLPSLGSARKARANKENRRDKRLQLLITLEEYDYLNFIAWKNKRSVNDYMNSLIEKDMIENAEAYKANKGDK